MNRPFDSRLEYASTLPAAYYLDPAVLSREQEMVFAKTWQLVGRAEQVRQAGQYFTTSVGTEPILIVRGVDGGLRAMSNVCRHRAGPVARGEGQRPVLQCQYHGWTYTLEGRLVTTPEFEGVQCFERADVTLPQFRIEEWQGLVFVNLSSDGPSLAGTLGGLQADLSARDLGGFRSAARKEWRLSCNWKVYVDNYLEGYHIPIVHPGLFRELDYARYRTETRDNYSIQFAPTRRSDRIRAGSADDGVRYYWLYPNLMLNVYPDNFSTNLILPLGPDRTVTIFEWFFRDPELAGSRSEVAQTIAFSDEIQLEDIEICEAVQRGLGSATYESGRYSPQRENGVHHFHLLYAQAMGLEIVGSLRGSEAGSVPGGANSSPRPT